MGNFIRAQRERKDPCFEVLSEYVSCVERHQGQVPDPYETEWCLQEQAAYLACREAAWDKNKKQAVTKSSSA